jgi:amino acid permease
MGLEDQDKLINLSSNEKVNDSESSTTEKKLSSDFQIFANNIKIFLGNIYLTMPSVFNKTGWLGGILMYSMIAALNTYTMTSMLKVVDVIAAKKGEVKSYSDLSRKIFGKKGKLITDICMFIVQFTCCVGYLYFISE